MQTTGLFWGQQFKRGNGEEREEEVSFGQQCVGMAWSMGRVFVVGGLAVMCIRDSEATGANNLDLLGTKSAIIWDALIIRHGHPSAPWASCHTPPGPLCAGTLDQGNGTLEIFDQPSPDVIYPAALNTFDNMGRVIDNLFARSQKIVV